MMTLWEQAGIVVNDGGELTPESLQGADGRHERTTTSTARCPSGAPTPSAPYTAVCSSKVSLAQWDGETLRPSSTGRSPASTSSPVRS